MDEGKTLKDQIAELEEEMRLRDNTISGLEKVEGRGMLRWWMSITGS